MSSGGPTPPITHAISAPFVAMRRESNPGKRTPSAALTLIARRSVDLRADFFTTSDHFTTSALTIAAKSSGESATISAPSAPSFSRTSGSARIFTISVFSRFTIAGGVPAGAKTPCHEPTSKPGSPDSVSVGTSGAISDRFAVVTASALSLPALASGHAVVMLSKVIVTWPPTTSCSAGGLPLYGMCCMSTPAIVLKSSPDRCCDVPLPDEANVYFPGLAFSKTTSSFTSFAGTPGLTTSMFGTRAIIVIGMKSLTGS